MPSESSPLANTSGVFQNKQLTTTTTSATTTTVITPNKPQVLLTSVTPSPVTILLPTGHTGPLSFSLPKPTKNSSTSVRSLLRKKLSYTEQFVHNTAKNNSIIIGLPSNFDDPLSISNSVIPPVTSVKHTSSLENNTKKTKDNFEETVDSKKLLPFITKSENIFSVICADGGKTEKSLSNVENDDDDVLVIGSDLVISRTVKSSTKNDTTATDKPGGTTNKEVTTCSQGLENHEDLTIEKIGYKCKVLQDHSQSCACSTPRLHVYLTENHRCDSKLCAPNVTAVNTQDKITNLSLSTDVSIIPSPPRPQLSSKLNIKTKTMTGKARCRGRGRKTSHPGRLSQRLSEPGQDSKEQLNSRMRKSKLGSSLVSRRASREPESELLEESECELLPTSICSLSGIEYVVLDDDALNISKKDTPVSPDSLKTKINKIYDIIDEKSLYDDGKASTTQSKGWQASDGSPQDASKQSVRQSQDVGHTTEYIKVKDEHPTVNAEDPNSSLAGVCTNLAPSIRDIFGDVSIKEEPLDDMKPDMSVEDFNKEVNKLSKIEFAPIGGSLTQRVKVKTEDEEAGKGLFAKLIKEEASDKEEMQVDPLTSDDSLGPLQIDEECEPVVEEQPSPQSPVKEVTTSLPTIHIPTVNIISPFKIKIVLGNPIGSTSTGSSTVLADPLKIEPSSTLAPTTAPNRSNFLRKIKPKTSKGGTTITSTTTTTTSTSQAAPPAKISYTAINLLPNTIQSLTCIYCNTYCLTPQGLAEHLENHQKDGLIICYFCQKSFGDKTGMKRHMRTHTGEKPYQCQVCGKRFSLPGNFKKHRDIHEDVRTEPCSVCGKTFRRKEHLKYHMRTHTGEKPYTCAECGTSFTARYSLQIHMNIHLGKKPYKCNYCSKAFSDKSTMRKHVRVHTGEKPFRCEVCKRCFGESGTLAAHMATHRTERPYACNKCDLRFKTTGGLRQHDKVHTGEKQFACRFCGMKFLLKYNMTMHERIHTGEKPYSCSHCQRSFRSRSCLAKHVVLHGGDQERRFACDHCNRKFYRKAHLRRHIDMHLGIKNYECATCKKKFCTRGTLQSHLETFHSHGARRFPCHWCGRVYKRKIYVTTHKCFRNIIKREKGEELLSEQDIKCEPEEKDPLQTSPGESESSSIEIKSEPEEELVEDDDADISDENDDLEEMEESEFNEQEVKNDINVECS